MNVCEMVYVLNHVCEPRNMECYKHDHRSYKATLAVASLACKKKSGIQQESNPRIMGLFFFQATLATA